MGCAPRATRRGVPDSQNCITPAAKSASASDDGAPRYDPRKHTRLGKEILTEQAPQPSLQANDQSEPRKDDNDGVCPTAPIDSACTNARTAPSTTMTSQQHASEANTHPNLPRMNESGTYHPMRTDQSPLKTKCAPPPQHRAKKFDVTKALAKLGKEVTVTLQ